MALTVPPRAPLVRVLEALSRANIEACIGGSALLASMGLVDTVRDWDVTTDAPAEAVEHALAAAGITWRTTAPDERYATGRHLVVEDVVDVIVGFAIRTGDEVVVLPSRPTSVWQGLPMADPAVWAVAYRLLGRPDRAALLEP